MKKPVFTYAFWLLILVIIFLSFRLFSSRYYSALNSDNTIAILMLHYYNLPHDWYAWGQDRMGSLIPMLGQIFHVEFGLTALMSESIVHYILLTLGYFAFASFFKSKFYKLIFAIFWLWPPFHMIDVTQFAFGIHYSLIGICCFLLKFKDEKIEQDEKIKYHGILVLISLLGIVTVWVTDLSMISLITLAGIYLVYQIKESSIKVVLKKPDPWYFGIAFLTGMAVIAYLKSGYPRNNYFQFSSFNEVLTSLNIFFESIISLIAFKDKEIFTGIYMILVIVIFLTIIFIQKKSPRDETNNKWIIYFLLEALLVFGVIMISKWTLDNNVPRRYFTCTYISLGIASLLYMESLAFAGKKIFQNVFLVTVLIGGIGTVYHLKYVWPATLTPKADIMAEFEQLGNIGIIAEYWNSYVSAVTNPDLIVTTSHDGGAPKNPDFVITVFQQKRLFINRDGWLDDFPDTLQQFGRTLIKTGDPIFIGDSHLHEYKIVGKPQ